MNQKAKQPGTDAVVIWVLTIVLNIIVLGVIYFGIKTHVNFWIVALIVGLIETAVWVSRGALAPAGFFQGRQRHK